MVLPAIILTLVMLHIAVLRFIWAHRKQDPGPAMLANSGRCLRGRAGASADLVHPRLVVAERNCHHAVGDRRTIAPPTREIGDECSHGLEATLLDPRCQLSNGAPGSIMELLVPP